MTAEEAARSVPADPGPVAGPRAASPITSRAAIAMAVGALVLVGLATIGGFVLGGGTAASSPPGSAVIAGAATPSPVVTAAASPRPESPGPSAAPVASGSPGVAEVTPAPTPISPAASAKAQELMAMIPEAAGSCGEPRDTDGQTWLAGFICSSDSAPEGVSYYTYHLYPDAASLQDDYESWLRYYEIRAGAAGPCAEGVEEEAAWSPSDASADAGGRFFCGVRDGWPDISWTDTTTNVLAEIQGSGGADLGELYAWWATRTLDPVAP